MRTKIYFLRDENRFVRYVGKTCNSLKNRLQAHIKETKQGVHTHKCNWIRSMLKRGIEPTIDLITEVEGNGSCAEKAYIKWLRYKGVKLTNEMDGGEGRTKGKKHKLSTVILIKKAQIKWKLEHPKGLSVLRKMFYFYRRNPDIAELYKINMKKLEKKLTINES